MANGDRLKSGSHRSSQVRILPCPFLKTKKPSTKLFYTKVKKDGKVQFEHIRTWEMFHGKRRPGYQIHHIDGNPRNNSITNLVELKTEYHLTYHKLAKILKLSIRKMNIQIGMLPQDNALFYSKIDELAAQYKVKVESAEFSKRRKSGTGLSKEESTKKRMITTGKRQVAAGFPAYHRSTKSATEQCKANAKKYFGSIKSYSEACNSKL